MLFATWGGRGQGEARAIIFQPRTSRERIQGLTLACGMLLSVTTAMSCLAGDLRGGATLRWTAPSNQGGAAASYDLRVSSSPPGSDLEAWWASALSQSGLPTPGQPGFTDAWSGEFAVGVTLWAGIRSSDHEGDLSDMTQAESFTTDAAPFIQSVSPRRVDSGAFSTFTLAGLGMGEISSVQFEVNGSSITGVWLTPLNAQTLEVSATLPAGSADVDILVSSSGGTDRLRGWVKTVEAIPGPPEPILNLSAAALDYSSVRLTWTAPADELPTPGSPVVAYRIRRLAGSPGNWNWDSGTQFPAPTPRSPGSSETFLANGLSGGETVAFAVKSQDSEGSWSAISNIGVVTLPPIPAPEEPPATIHDLVVTADPSGASVILSWTSPVDPEGPQADLYLIRMMSGPEATWESGESVPADSPLAPGSPELLLVSGLIPGSYPSFGVRSRGTTGRWSTVSNRVSVVLPGDGLPPTAVSDLSAALKPDDSVVLTWTQPPEPDVAIFEVRRSSVPGVFSWGAGETVGWVQGGSPGTQVTLEVPGVAPGFYATWGVLSADHSDNRSPISNLAVIDRLDVDITAPALPESLTADQNKADRVQLRWRAGGDDELMGRASFYELVVVRNPDILSDWWLSNPSEVLPQSPKASGKKEFHTIGGLVHDGSVYGFALSSVDEAGLRSGWITKLTRIDGTVAMDTSPPTAPGGVMAVRTEFGIAITWMPSPDGDVAAYRIYRKDALGVVLLAEVPAGTHQYATPSGVQSGMAEYSVTSVDQDENESVIALWEELQDIPKMPTASATAQGWELIIPESTPTDPQLPAVAIYDIQGRLVANPGVALEGPVWRATWNGEGRFGRRLVAGVYFMRMSHHGTIHTSKLVLTP